MNGITFGDYHSWDDFSLILSPEWEIEAPTPKIEEIDIPGGDGTLDYTETFGEVKYKNRKITLPFSTIVNRSEFWELFSKIQNSIHGKSMKIVFDTDADNYYIGRVSVDKWKADKNIGKITIEVMCAPYKYRKHKTVRVDTVTGSGTLLYLNSRKSVMPKITLSANATIGFNGATVALNAGSYSGGDIIFREGINALSVTGSTTITVEYQEAEL